MLSFQDNFNIFHAFTHFPFFYVKGVYFYISSFLSHLVLWPSLLTHLFINKSWRGELCFMFLRGQTLCDGGNVVVQARRRWILTWIAQWSRVPGSIPAPDNHTILLVFLSIFDMCITLYMSISHITITKDGVKKQYLLAPHSMVCKSISTVQIFNFWYSSL